MSTQKIALIVSLIAVFALGAFLLLREPAIQEPIIQPSSTSTPSIPSTATSTPPMNPATSTTDVSGMIRVTTPVPNQVITSPLMVRGEARGPWYFEASFPMKLLDANGTQLAILPVQAQGEWMTESFVPFNAEMRFATPTTETGTLVLEKDNPSGLPQYAAELRIPVRFDRSTSASTTAERAVKLYYYNPAKDKDASGNILCSSKGLVAVERMIPRTLAPIRDAVNTLLKGELTVEERNQGITTEFPLPGLELTLASLTSSVLTLTFNDPQNKTSGGSCRAMVLWAQIEATAKQFGGVTVTKFKPETLFQP